MNCANHVFCTFDLKSELEVPYPRADWAEFVMVSLKTDKELSDTIEKTMEVVDKVLKVCVLDVLICC